MILTATPLRVSLFGGGTDYPEWFLRHGGAVLGMAINQHVYVGVKRMPPGQIGANDAELRYRVQYSHVDEGQSVKDVKHPAVRAALRYVAALGRDEPLDFHCFSDLPARAGLGSSSAFAVGLLKALQTHHSLPADGPLELAREAIAFERCAVKETVGFQDQIFAACGGVNLVRFGTLTEVVRLSLPAERLAELERSLVLVYSGSMRDAHVMAAKQVERIPHNERLLRMMARQTEVGFETLTSGGPLWPLALTLNAAWELKRELAPEISTPEIDALYERGRRAGALGGKLLGAGGGGYVLFFVPPERMGKFEAEIGAQIVKFKVAQRGSHLMEDES